MRILIINPNSTSSMTDGIATAARVVAAEGTVIVARNPADGPPAIQGAEDGEKALPGLFALFDAELQVTGSYDAVIIACFDDTGLWELKRRTSIPVIGIGEAAFHAAMLVARKFSVVTTLAVSVPVIEENIARYGFNSRCARVRASGVPVLDLESARGQSGEAIAAEIEAALAQDQSDAIVLGCAGMADLAAQMSDHFGVPVIDGVAAAVGICQTLHNMALANDGPGNA